MRLCSQKPECVQIAFRNCLCFKPKLRTKDGERGTGTYLEAQGVFKREACPRLLTFVLRLIEPSR